MLNKTIELLQNLQSALPRPLLLTMYKSFIRPHLSHSGIIYDQAYIASFPAKR